jgi:hypothetical protein
VVESQPSKLLVAGSIPVSRSRNLEARQARDWVAAEDVAIRGARPGPSRDKKRLAQDDKMAFEQAAIKVQKEQEYAKLQAAVEQAFLPDKVERFLKQLDRKGIRIRDFDRVLTQRVLEVFADGGLDAKWLYDSLPVSDQAQTREFYLSKLEGVDTSLRHKFKKLYQYY